MLKAALLYPITNSVYKVWIAAAKERFKSYTENSILELRLVSFLILYHFQMIVRACHFPLA